MEGWKPHTEQYEKDIEYINRNKKFNTNLQCDIHGKIILTIERQKFELTRDQIIFLMKKFKEILNKKRYYEKPHTEQYEKDIEYIKKFNTNLQCNIHGKIILTIEEQKFELTRNQIIFLMIKFKEILNKKRYYEKQQVD